MKKSLIALAVVASGSAQAGFDLYDNNGINVNLSGAAEVQYADRDFNKKSNGDFRIDDADLQLNTTVKLSDSLNAVAGMGFAYEAQTVNADELWAGFSGNFGTLTFGRQLLISDDAGIGKDYELGFKQINFVDTAGEGSIKYRFDNGQFYFGASHEAGANSGDKEITDAVVGMRMGAIDVRAYGYKGENLLGETAFVNATGYNIEAEYNMNALSLAASYGQMNYENSINHNLETDLEVLDLAASYTIGKNTFAVGYNRSEADKSLKAMGITAGHSDNIYTNVTHKFNDNVRIYGELGLADHNNEASKDLAYVAGMEVKF